MMKIMYQVDDGVHVQTICITTKTCHNCNDYKPVLIFDSNLNEFIQMKLCKKCLIEMFDCNKGGL